jgi:xanthine dehydrogenase molybdopterin-binding subunit B
MDIPRGKLPRFLGQPLVLLSVTQWASPNNDINFRTDEIHCIIHKATLSFYSFIFKIYQFKVELYSVKYKRTEGVNNEALQEIRKDSSGLISSSVPMIGFKNR